KSLRGRAGRCTVHSLWWSHPGSAAISGREWEITSNVERIDSRHFVGRLDRGMACRKDCQGHGLRICIGIIGALIGSWLLPQLGIQLGAGIISSIIAATIGAIILLIILRLVNRGGRWGRA